MKKLILVVCFSFFLIGCGKKDFDLNEIEMRVEPYFKEATRYDIETFTSRYPLEGKFFQDGFIFFLSQEDVFECCFVLKPFKNMEKEAKEEINKFFTLLEGQYSLYYPEEALKINNHKEKVQDGYLIYVVSIHEKKIFDVIK